MVKIDGANEDIAREALHIAAMKLPIKTRTIVIEDEWVAVAFDFKSDESAPW